MEDRIYKPGEQIAHYQVLELIGVGGFSAVYKAHDLKDSPESSPSAVKISRFDFHSVPKELRFDLNGRTKREFELLQHLEHRSIISVFESGFHENAAWYAMEWLDGYVALGSYLARERRRYQEFALIFRQLASALTHAHKAGVVHRDLTPGNILVSPKAERLEEAEVDDVDPPRGSSRGKQARVPVLIDFGISHGLGVAPITAPGALLGTAEYLSPGYARAFLEGMQTPYRAEPHDDVYQAGVMLYAMLTGRLPTRTPPARLRELMEEIRSAAPPPVLSVNPAAPPALADLAMRCLEKRGERRPADGSELLWRFNEATYEDAEHLFRLAPEYRVGEGTAAPSILPPARIELARPVAQQPAEAPSAPATQAAPSGPGTQDRDVHRESPLFRIFASVTWGLAAFMFFSLLGQWMGRPFFVQWSEPFSDDLLVREMSEKGRARVLVPKNPANGQMLPPCNSGDVEINGGCWIGPIKGMDVPCAPKYYEHKNECYVPIAADPKKPVSIDGGTIGDGGNKSDGGYDGDGGQR